MSNQTSTLTSSQSRTPSHLRQLQEARRFQRRWLLSQLAARWRGARYARRRGTLWLGMATWTSHLPTLVASRDGTVARRDYRTSRSLLKFVPIMESYSSSYYRYRYMYISYCNSSIVPRNWAQGAYKFAASPLPGAVSRREPGPYCAWHPPCSALGVSTHSSRGLDEPTAKLVPTGTAQPHPSSHNLDL